MDTQNFYAVYPYGSRVYQTITPESDYDYYALREGAETGELIQNQINLVLMSPAHFQKLLNEHHIAALECYFLPPKEVLKPPTTPFDFKLSLPTLRHSVSTKANHAFVKAKKKFVAPYDWAIDEIRRGKKSLFHSFRILKFGIQIAKDGQISDYQAANAYFEEIMQNDSLLWEDYQKRWQPEYNKLATEFRKWAPKE